MLPALWEQRDEGGYWRGLTDNYLEVATQSERNLYNQITLAKIV